jgi:hypothetical protein
MYLFIYVLFINAIWNVDYRPNIVGYLKDCRQKRNAKGMWKEVSWNFQGRKKKNTMRSFTQWSKCFSSTVNKLLLSYFRQYQLPFWTIFWTPNCYFLWAVAGSDSASALSQVAKNGLFITTKSSTVQRHTSCVDGLMTANIYVDRLKKNHTGIIQ